MKPDIWIDGQFVSWEKACIHPLCHSLQRGATLFESIDCIEAENGSAVIFRLRDHMLRFENSSHIVGMPLGYNLESLIKAVIDTVGRSGMKSCVIRPLAFYSDPVFDLHPGDSAVKVVIGLGERITRKETIQLNIARLRKIDCSSMPIKAKVSGNYIAPLIAKSEAINDGYDDTIILDREGFVAEGGTSNIFIVENGAIVTSPGDKILQGITRNTIMTLAEKLGIMLIEELFTPERLKQADEVFLSSSGMGVMPVTYVEDSIISDGVPGPVTKKLRIYYSDVITGKVPEFIDWLTYI